MGDRSYLLLHAGFFTCGFHIAFLVTHLPQEVNLCGLPPTVASWSLAIIGLANIAGSLVAGSATARYRSKYILAWMYGSRAAADRAVPRWRRRRRSPSIIFAVGLGLHLARHRAADRGDRRQALRHALPRHAVRPDAALAPDRRLPRRLPRRPRVSSAPATTSGCGTPTWRSPLSRPSSTCRSVRSRSPLFPCRPKPKRKDEERRSRGTKAARRIWGRCGGFVPGSIVTRYQFQSIQLPSFLRSSVPHLSAWV